MAILPLQTGATLNSSSLGNGDTLDTPDGLLSLAQQHGGSVAEAANELVHPTTGILSTMGDAFKNAFGDFVNTISIPSEAVAGLLDPNKSIGQAIDTHERVSDVVFGNRNPNASTVQKVGSFFARTAVDILTDPLTYLTFGAADGVFGLRSLARVDVGINAAKTIGAVAEGAEMTSTVAKNVSRGGQNVLDYLNLLKKQMTGQVGLDTAVAASAQKAGTAGAAAAEEFTTGVKNAALDLNKLRGGAPITDFEGDAFKQLMKDTLDAPLSVDFAKRAVTNLMEKSPALANTLLDKGGIKFLGRTMLSGQRIRSTLSMVPGMTAIDTLTSPTRMALGALFNPNIQKVAGQYVRIPEEMVHFMQQAKDFTEATGIDATTKLADVIRANKLTSPELNHVMAALVTRKMPADARLANGYMQLMNLKDENKAFIEARGGHVSTMENHVGNVLAPTDVRKVSFAGGASGKIGASERAGNAKFIAQDGEKNVTEKLPTLSEQIKTMPGGAKAVAEINDAKSVQDVGFAVGRHTDALVQHLVANGSTFEDAFKNKDVQSLIEMRQNIDSLPQNEQFVGTAETHGLKPQEGTDFFTNNTGKVFKRVAASAQELSDSGITGFDTNLATSMATRFIQNINQGITSEFLQNFGRFFGKLESEAPSGWVHLDIKKPIDTMAQLLGKEGETVMFHPAMAHAAEDMFKSLTSDPASSDFLKAFDKMQQYWKASVTSIFPQFHGRNAVSNVLLNFLDLGYHVFNPATHTAAIDLLNKDRQATNLAREMLGTGTEAVKAREDFQTLMNTKVYTDAQGADYTFGEMRAAIKNHGVAFNKNQLGQIDPYSDRERMFTQIAPHTNSTTKKVINAVNPFNVQTFIPTKVGLATGNLIESQARIVNFLSNLKATGDVTHAAQRTKEFLFDYGSLSNFEKSFMRRVIPFYTFTRKNLELQVKTLMETPGRVAGQLTTLGTLGDSLSGGNLTDQERAALPDWVKSGIGILASKKGETVSILTGLGTPIEQPFQAFQPNQLLGSISPLIRLPVEQASGYSFFQGKMLSDVTNAAGYKSAPKAIQQLIGFTKIDGKHSDGTPFTWYVALDPSMMNLINNLPFTGRVLSGLKQMQAVDVSNQYKILQQTVGVRPYSFDLVQEQQKRQDELAGKLQDLLTKAGVTAQFTRTFVPKQ